MKVLTGIKSENIVNVANTLIGILADEFILYVQTRKALWNVESLHFFYLHELCEDQYSMIGKVVDDVAERIGAMGHYAPTTLREYLRLSHLVERANQTKDDTIFLRDLLNSNESIITNLRKHIDGVDQKLPDAATRDFITGILTTHEKMAWIVRSHLDD
jgi:starvation-inducible DNA-binding protein